MDVDMREEDEVNYMLNYKLYREEKSWSDANDHCWNEGGQLVSIHSEDEQAMALKAADGNEVWIGGRKYPGEQWFWYDDSTWGFTNWESGRGNDDDDYYLSMKPSGMWYDSDMSSAEQNYFLCRGITVAITKNGLTRLELKKEQLTFFPFYLTLKSPAVNQRMSNSPSDEKRLSGFTVSWFKTATAPI